MIATDVMGIVFSNTHDELVRELTEQRAMGSVPFGGRYRIIDFSLSNLVNAGISKVGVITKSNYQSLLDHLGSGKPWELARKRDGLFLLPPYGRSGAVVYHGRVDAINGIMSFLQHSTQEYVVMCDADIVSNIDIEQLVDFHIERGADVTVAYKNGEFPRGLSDILSMRVDQNGRVNDMQICPFGQTAGDYSLDMFVIGRKFLIQIIHDAVSRNHKYFARDVLLSNLREFQIFGYEIKGYTAVIDGMKSYLDANMALLRKEIRAQLFDPTRPVYTKVRDDMPAKYGLGSHVSNSIIADGCVIEGKVENCVLFRGVRVGKNANLRNCIIMQDTVIHDGAQLSFVITDKDVEIGEGRTLMGFESYPVFISKGSSV